MSFRIDTLKNFLYPAPSFGKDFDGERVPIIQDKKLFECEKEEEKLNKKVVEVPTATYNVSKAKKEYQKFEELEGKKEVKTIDELYKSIKRLKKKVDKLGLKEFEGFSDKEIEDKQIRYYLKKGIFDNSKVNKKQFQYIPPNELVHFWLDKDEFGIEFDKEAWESLPLSDEEKLWSCLYSARRAEQFGKVKKIVEDFVYHSDSVELFRKLYVVERSEEFQVELKKMERAIELEQIPDEKHFIFSSLRDAIYLTRATYEGDHILEEQIANGERGQLPQFRDKLEEITESKYQFLADYFRKGCYMEQLSTDFHFDGLKMKNLNPFGESGGFVRSIDFSTKMLSSTTLYKSSASCFGKTPLKRQRDLERKIKGIRNVGAFFEALLAGEAAKQRLERLSFCGNHFNERDFFLLVELIRETQIQHLDLSDTVFPEENFHTLYEAIGACDRLVTVNFSNIRLRTELPDGCCSSNNFHLRKINDIETSLLLRNLQQSKDTLIEVWCHGPGFSLGLEEAPKINKNRRLGLAEKESEKVMSEIIFTFPRLVSYNFSFQKASPNFAGNAAISLMNNKKIAWPILEGVQSEDRAAVESMCSVSYHTIYDRPSELVIDQIEEMATQNRDRVAATKLIQVVRQMYDEYVRNRKIAKENLKREKENLEEKKSELLRNEFEAAHRIRLEEKSVEGSKTIIQIMDHT